MLFILRKLPFLLLVFLRVDATQNIHNSKHEKRLVRLKPNQSISQQNFEKDGPRNLKKSKRRSYGKQSSKNSKKAGSKASKASSSRPKQRSPEIPPQNSESLDENQDESFLYWKPPVLSRTRDNNFSSDDEPSLMPTRTPVQPTEPPVILTVSPMPSIVPVDTLVPTEAPIQPTEPPIRPTEAPVHPTESPVITTPPVVTEPPISEPPIMTEPPFSEAPVGTDPPTESPISQPSKQPLTSLPTLFTLQRTLPQYTLEYIIPNVGERDVTRSDLVDLESLTYAYLQNHFFGALSSSDVILEDFVTEYTSSETDPGALVDPSTTVAWVTFVSTAYFDPLSPLFPTLTALFDELTNAFTDEELAGYLGMVQALPNMNIFSSTMQISLKGTAMLRVEPETASVPTLILAAVGILLLSTGTAVIAVRHRRGQRWAGLDKFKNGIGGTSMEDISSRVSREDGENNNDYDDGYDKNEKGLESSVSDDSEKLSFLSIYTDSESSIYNDRGSSSMGSNVMDSEGAVT